MRKHLFSLSAFLLLSACGSGGGSSSSASPTPNTPASPAPSTPIDNPPQSSTPSSLDGKAWARCNSGLGGSSTKFTYGFNEGLVFYSYAIHDGPDCTGVASTDTEVFQAEYTLGNEVNTSNGGTAQEINFNVISSFGTSLETEFQYGIFDIVFFESDALFFSEDIVFEASARGDTIDFENPFFPNDAIPTFATAPAPNPNVSTVLDGTWRWACALEDSDALEESYSTAEITFSGNGFTSVNEYFTDSNCQTPRVSSNSNITMGLYTLGETVTSDEGLAARAIDIFVTVVDGEIFKAESFDLVYIDGVNLYFGDESNASKDGALPSRRPSSVDLNNNLVKQ